jgi:LysM repeat protein
MTFKRSGRKFVIHIDEAHKYIPENQDKILDILITEGKKTLGDQVLAGTLSFTNFIYTDNYFLTTFDIWLLITKYEIPTIFICQKWILQTNYEKHEFVGYGNESDDFAFIMIPGFRPENVPGYKLIQSEKGDIFISLNKLNPEGVEKIEDAFRNKKTIEQYLDEYEIPKLTVYPLKKPNKIVIESDEEEKPKPKPKRKLLIVESTTPISPEEYILKPKKKKASVPTHLVQMGETMWLISQKYAVKLNSLYRKNLMDEGTEPKPGVVLQLQDKASIRPDTGRSIDKAQKTHIVLMGETLYAISKKYGVSVDDLKSANQLSTDQISRGQELIVPDSQQNYLLYEVKSGDTLFGISRKFGKKVEEIKNWNQMVNDGLQLGQKLKIYP